MALYFDDILNVELENGTLNRSFLNRPIGKGDVKANRFGVQLFRNGIPVNIGNGSCEGFFMGPEGTNILISGSDYTGVDGNKAWVQLPQACYNYEGQFALAIKVIDSSVTGTMRIVDGTVDNTGVTGAVAPTESIPTYQEIIGQYDAMVAATAATEEATEDAIAAANSFSAVYAKDGMKHPRGVSEFSYTGGDFTFGENSIYANTTTKPYYFGTVRKFALSFDLTLASGKTDFWIGMEKAGTSEDSLICVNLLDQGTIRNIKNGDQSAAEYSSALEYEYENIEAGDSYSIFMTFETDTLFVYSGTTQICKIKMPSSADIIGVGFLNFGLASGMLSNLVAYSNGYGRSLYMKPTGIGSVNGNLLSHIIEEGAYEIGTPSEWTDIPEAVAGVLEIHRFNNNYNVQLFYPYGKRNVSPMFRIVNRNTYATYSGWQTIGIGVTDLTIDNAYVTAHSLTGFAGFPENKVCRVQLTNSGDYYDLGLPVDKLGTFVNIRPGTVSTYGFSVCIYTTFRQTGDGTSSMPMTFICFGTGAVYTPWKMLNTTDQLNPLSSALIRGEEIIFAGDSIIAGLGSSDYSLTGDYIMEYHNISRYENTGVKCWVNQFIAYLKSLYGSGQTIKNRGVGGINLQDLISNWNTIVGTGPKTVILGIGTNNYQNPVNLVNGNLSNLMYTCAANNQKLILVNNVPNNTDSPEQYNRIRGYLTQMAGLAGVQLIDMYGGFISKMYNKDLSLDTLISADGIHPTDAGYAVMFQVAKELFGV